MELLPGDMLAAIMSRLSVADVLSCRLVCKRLADASLIPDVWRHRRVYDDDPLLGPVLHLAPCLDELVATLSSERCLVPLDADVSCAAVRRLSLRVEGLSGRLAARLIEQQHALGRLTAVHLDFSLSNANAHIIDVVLRALTATTGLEELSLTGINYMSTTVEKDPYRSQIAVAGPVTPSLKRFSCCLSHLTRRFRNHMLAAHAATLEAVDFIVLTGQYDPAGHTARLLAAMPNLRQLSCPLIPGLEQVAACESLRDLKLTVDFITPDSRKDGSDHITKNTPGAAELLRIAEQLRFIHLYFPGHAPDFGEKMIRALASSGRSQVESLCIGTHPTRGVADCSVQKALLKALPWLPALRILEVTLPSQQLLLLLLGISPDTAPALRSLRLHAGGLMCAHALLHHQKAVRTRLLRNTSLHIQIYSMACPACNCDECDLDWHQDDGKRDVKYVGIFAHPKGDCPYPEHHVAQERVQFEAADALGPLGHSHSTRAAFRRSETLFAYPPTDNVLCYRKRAHELGAPTPSCDKSDLVSRDVFWFHVNDFTRP